MTLIRKTYLASRKKSLQIKYIKAEMISSLANSHYIAVKINTMEAGISN